MSEETSSLTFCWKIKGENYVEVFSDPQYEPSDEVSEICDYIFQSHSAQCSYKFNELEGENEGVDPVLNEYFSLNIALDDLFVKAVCCLKSVFVSFLRFESYCVYDLPIEAKQGDVNSAKELILNFLNGLPRSNFCMTLSFSLKNALNTFEKKKDTSEINKWLDDFKKKIQQKANEITTQMEKCFEYDEWDDLDAFCKGRCDGQTLISLKTKIDKYKNLANDTIKTLSLLTEGYTKYVKKHGCYALCITDDGKYYSLSGTSDCEDTWKDHPNIQEKKGVDILSLKNILNPGNDFTYAPLTDDVMCYCLWKNSFFPNPYLAEPERFFDTIQKYRSDFCSRDVSCCERKIFAAAPNATNYKFFIRYEPCILCRPAMLPSANGNRNVVCFVPSAKGEFLRKMKIKQRVQWYELIDVYREESDEET